MTPLSNPSGCLQVVTRRRKTRSFTNCCSIMIFFFRLTLLAFLAATTVHFATLIGTSTAVRVITWQSAWAAIRILILGAAWGVLAGLAWAESRA